jgi:hypothetical protein
LAGFAPCSGGKYYPLQALDGTISQVEAQWLRRFQR